MHAIDKNCHVMARCIGALKHSRTSRILESAVPLRFGASVRDRPPVLLFASQPAELLLRAHLNPTVDIAEHRCCQSRDSAESSRTHPVQAE